MLLHGVLGGLSSSSWLSGGCPAYIRAAVAVAVLYAFSSAPLLRLAPLNRVLLDLATRNSAALVQVYQHEFVWRGGPVDCALNVGVKFPPPHVSFGLSHRVQRAASILTKPDVASVLVTKPFRPLNGVVLRSERRAESHVLLLRRANA